MDTGQADMGNQQGNRQGNRLGGPGKVTGRRQGNTQGPSKDPTKLGILKMRVNAQNITTLSNSVISTSVAQPR